VWSEAEMIGTEMIALMKNMTNIRLMMTLSSAAVLILAMGGQVQAEDVPPAAPTTASPQASAPPAPMASPAPAAVPQAPAPVSPQSSAPPPPLVPSPSAAAPEVPAPVSPTAAPPAPAPTPAPAAEPPSAAPSATPEESAPAEATPAEGKAKKTKKKAEKPAEEKPEKKKEKHAGEGYYGSMGGQTDLGDSAKRHQDQGYYTNIPATPQQYPVEPKPVAPVEVTPPPPPVQPEVVAPRPEGPGRKFGDETGETGSITVTRHLTKAKDAMESGNYSEARGQWREVIRLAPDQIDAYTGMFQACAKINDWSTAADSLEKLFIKDPSKEKDYYADYGEALFELRKYDKAAVALRKAAGYGKSMDVVHHTLARVALAQTNTQTGITELIEYLKIKPGDADVQKQVGALLETAQRVPEALVHYKASVKVKPDGPLMGRIAYMMLLNKDYSGSIAMYKQAVMADPKNYNTYNQSIKYAEQQRDAASKPKKPAEE
jgi:tetratricopeptide (TPR) repeat protein